jgi:hypothetical protein
LKPEGPYEFGDNMTQQDRLNKEIAEMEAMLNPTRPEEAKPPVEVEVPDTPEVVVQPEAIEVIEEVQEKPKRTNWKKLKQDNDKRIAGLKVKADRLVHERKAQAAEIEALRAQLEAQPAVPSDPFKDLFSEEDVETIGEEAVDIIKKASTTASEASTKQLKAELAQMKEEAKEAEARAAKQNEQVTYDDFLSNLGEIVENYDSIDRDPAFLAFLEDVDRYSGYTKMELLQRAKNSGDVKRVASFFKDFVKESDPNSTILEEMVSPTGNNGPSTPQEDKEEKMPQSYMDNYYNDAMRGRYKSNPSLSKEISDKIDKALATNMIEWGK